jgi:hypothetical protein
MMKRIVDDDDGLVERYLELGLRLGKLIPGFVDSYYGPPQLAARIDLEPPQGAAALRTAASKVLKDNSSAR